MPDQSTQSITITAAPAQIMAVISDFESYPEWVNEIKSVEITAVGEDGLAHRVAFTIDASIVKDRYELEYDWHGDAGVSWHLVKGQMQKAQVGSYVLRSTDAPGVTEVVYALTVDTAIPVLGMLKRKAERVIVDTALKGLKKRVESIDG
ncbi:polyketide cyclase/dehydrase/lipid transport protein [Jatrophihabitans sp. GAS493]|uniref:SRPBCC family protein n=1 Tax=Jatrophihabitans sp. GAS493 TaxID=1907575 RepID=UPI000BB827EA|nr:SRPBCC family protein [Jatrophihabitans sp. GAS493]SOD74378.1 polyketide cyclase/dehydrase/lipid transport protein [Jatrophihabitans sp. GAS493]